MRATLEHAESKGETDIPPITVRVFKTKNDITIKISDVGGGISRASSGKIFNYMYSTAPQVWLIPTRGRLAPQLLSCLGRHPWRWRLAGCRTVRRVVTNARPRLRPASVQTICKVNIGVIISLVSRLSLSRYFRGDIQIASVDGYGTDVYVYLQRLSHLAQENLPVYNAVSSAKLRNSATQVHDWTDLPSTQWPWPALTVPNCSRLVFYL